MIDTEDFTSSLIKFKNGVAAHFVSTTCAWPGVGTELQLTGTNGSIHVDGNRMVAWRIRGERWEEEQAEMLERFATQKNSGNEADLKGVRGHAWQVQDMVDAVRFDRDPMVGPMEATKSVGIINAIYESARTGMEVKI
jgi:predicted dehydrogenase